MKVVVSTCLFQNLTARRHRPYSYYSRNLPRYVSLFPLVYSGWELHIHHDENIQRLDFYENLQQYISDGWLILEPVDFKSLVKSTSQLHRQRPIWYSDADYVFCDDIDSTPCPKMAKARKHFIGSGFDVHSIRGCQQHEQHIMGGLCGFRCEAVRKQISSFEEFISNHEAVDDMEYEMFYLDAMFYQRNYTVLIHASKDAKVYDKEIVANLPEDSLHGIDSILDKSVKIVGGI